MSIAHAGNVVLFAFACISAIYICGDLVNGLLRRRWPHYFELAFKPRKPQRPERMGVFVFEPRRNRARRRASDQRHHLPGASQ